MTDAQRIDNLIEMILSLHSRIQMLEEREIGHLRDMNAVLEALNLSK